MSGRSIMTLINQVVSFAVMAVLAFILIPTYGINGAALAVAGGVVFVNIIRLYQAYRIIGTTPFSLYLVKPILSIFIAGALVYFTFPINKVYYFTELMPLSAMVLMIYFMLLFLMGINKEDQMLLLAARDRLLRTIS
jgi:O-antigen/teichoic acid export membrane protein